MQPPSALGVMVQVRSDGTGQNADRQQFTEGKAIVAAAKFQQSSETILRGP